MISYLIFGSGMYIGMGLANYKSFSGADFASLFRGVIICFLFWPVGLIAKIIEIIIQIEPPTKEVAKHQHILAEKEKRIERLKSCLIQMKHLNHHTIEEEMWRIDAALQEETK